MDKEQVGKAIAFLRKRAGFTQKELADRIGITDKAVSKWERGIGMPDIAYLGKLCILLDTDPDSLLSGDVIHHDRGWRGLLVLPENQQGISACTAVCDKPMIYYLLGYFLLVGIRHIYISCTPEDRLCIERELSPEDGWGFTLEFLSDRATDVRSHLKNAQGFTNLMVVYGRSFLFGVDQTRFFQRAMVHRDRMTLLALPKKVSEKVGEKNALFFDQDYQIVAYDSEGRVYTQYDYHEIPMLFCTKEQIDGICVAKSDGTLRIRLEAVDSPVYTELLDRGYVEMPMNNPEQVLDAANFIRLAQNACGMEIYCLEEIAWRRGMLSPDAMKRLGERKARTEYGAYVLNLYERRGRERQEK